jgi:hypothetical protein
MSDADVSVVVVMIGGLLMALPFSVVCCCKPKAVWASFFAWFLVTALVSGLWHGLGRNWMRSTWSDANGGDVKSFTSWTAVWRTSDKTVLVVPVDERELRDAVVGANHLPLRVVGSGHSWSSTAYTDGTIVDIRNLNKVVSLDLFANASIGARVRYEASLKMPIPSVSVGTITLQAGMKVQSAAQFLVGRGLCLYGLGSIRSQAIGGVVSHGVHGPHPDGINRHVVGLKVLYANGTFARVTAEADLWMWRASMGMLGVIVEVTLEVFPLVRLSLQVTPISSFEDLDKVGLHLDERSASTFTGFLYPSSCSPSVGYQRVGTYIGTDDGGELNNQTGFGARLQLHFNDHMHPAMQYMFSPFGTIVSCIEQMLADSGRSTLLGVGTSEDILPND